jgi:acetyltransferase-like isoleucine patch superfamily enzyme
VSQAEVASLGSPDPDGGNGVLLGFPSTRPGAKRTFLMPADASLRPGTVLYAGSTFGRRFTTGHNVVVREDVTIGDDVSVWSNTVIDYSCTIGDRVKIHCNCYVAQFTSIEDDAFLAPGVTIANDLFPWSEVSGKAMCGPWIGAGAQIGANVTLLPFVHIGKGAVIGAGSVVTRDVPAGLVAYGNPAVAGRRVDQIDVEGRVREAIQRRERSGEG